MTSPSLQTNPHDVPDGAFVVWQPPRPSQREGLHALPAAVQAFEGSVPDETPVQHPRTHCQQPSTPLSAFTQSLA
jgi:hypothetical protein